MNIRMLMKQDGIKLKSSMSSLITIKTNISTNKIANVNKDQEERKSKVVT